MATPVESAELRRIERISTSTLSTWVKKGCPVARSHRDGSGRVIVRFFDPDKVKEWRMSRMGGPTIKRMAAHAADEQPVPKSEVKQTREELESLAAALKSGDGIVGAVDRLRIMERAAYQAYCEAVQTNNVTAQQMRIKLYSDIVQHLLKAEALIDIRKQIEEEVWDLCRQTMTAWAEPIKALVEQMPRAMSTRCNVNDPAVAEAALKDWVYSQMFPMMGRKLR